MNKPYFRADLVFPEGFSIHAVDQDVMKVEGYLKNHEKVKSYSVTLGGTPLRYYWQVLLLDRSLTMLM